MVTLEQISVALEHPLVLLLIGAGVSGVLVAWLTNRWDDHKKKLEIKMDIASKMAEYMSNLHVNAQVSINVKKDTFTDADRDTRFQNARKYLVDSRIIKIELENYFSDAGIDQRWQAHALALYSFSMASIYYFLKDPSEDEKRRLENSLTKIRAYFPDDDKTVDWDRLTTDMTYDKDLWDNVSHLLEQQGDQIIKDVLKHRNKIF
jgi:hypothetical protein